MSHIVHCGDWAADDGSCLLFARYIDAAIEDPPFSERVHERLGKETRNDGTGARDDLAFSAITTEQMRAHAVELARLVRSWSLLFCDEISLGEWVTAMETAGHLYVRHGVWVKTDAMPQMSGDRPAQGFEDFILFHSPRSVGDGRMRWNGGGRKLVYTGPSKEPGIDREHPCQKPEWLMRAMIRDFSNPGDTIGDFYCGSGSTGVAAKQLGRSFVGYEAIPANVAIARARIAKAAEQTELPLRKPKKAEQFKLGL